MFFAEFCIDVAVPLVVRDANEFSQTVFSTHKNIKGVSQDFKWLLIRSNKQDKHHPSVDSPNISLAITLLLLKFNFLFGKLIFKAATTPNFFCSLWGGLRFRISLSWNNLLLHRLFSVMQYFVTLKLLEMHVKVFHKMNFSQSAALKLSKLLKWLHFGVSCLVFYKM